MPGRDTGVSVIEHVLQSIPGYHIHHYESGSGRNSWVHIGEFAQRFLLMREKMTNPSHADYIHFSQFIASDADGIGPGVGSDFRALPELLRRKVKPAWFQLFNLTKVMCGVRKLVVDTYNPAMYGSFGFAQAFQDDGWPDSTESPAHRHYSTAQALRSLDLFLRLFPHGKLVIHLPVATLPGAKQRRPTCVCAGSSSNCRDKHSSTWTDPRLHMMAQLMRYHRFRPSRTLLTAASEDFQNSTRFTSRISTFLGVAETPSLQEEAARASKRWMDSRSQRRLLEAHSARKKGIAHACRKSVSLRRGESEPIWCPQSKCTNTDASSTTRESRRLADGCIECPLSLSEWAWANSAASDE